MSNSQTPVGWIGLGAMGSGMSASLVQQGFPVRAFDVWKPSLEAVAKAGATPCDTPAQAAEGVKVLGLMVVNAAQVEDVLFGEGNVAEGKYPKYPADSPPTRILHHLLFYRPPLILEDRSETP